MSSIDQKTSDLSTGMGALVVSTARETEQDLKCAACARVVNGYILQQMYSFFKICVPAAPMFFTSRGIYIEQGNADSTFYVNCFISKNNLPNYFFDINACNDPMWIGPNGEIGRQVVNVELDSFSTKLKSLTKKVGIEFYMYKGHSEFYGKIISGSNNSQTIRYSTAHYENVNYNIDDRVDDNTQPNIIKELSSFCSFFSDVVRNSYTELKFNVYPRGVIAHATSKTSNDNIISEWGTIDSVRYISNDDGTYDTVKVVPFTTIITKSHMKSLIKTANFHASGIVRIYSNNHGLVRFQIPTGLFSDLNIVIRGASTEVTNAVPASTYLK